MEKKMPEKKFRAGAVSATIWLNEGLRDGQIVNYPTVCFEKVYKDKSGQWKSTNSLNMSDIPKAIVVLSKAFEFLALKSKETS
ncbi:MAG: hypothetical protein QXU88_01980 [Candidatus Woesearchaeota archaeon]